MALGCGREDEELVYGEDVVWAVVGVSSLDVSSAVDEDAVWHKLLPIQKPEPASHVLAPRHPALVVHL